MEQEDAGVVISRWEADAAIAAIASLADDVRRFACRQGMAARAGQHVALAVSEAVADMLVHARDGSGREVVVEAATDGTWFSVRIDANWRSGGARAARVLPLVTTLADRVERGPRWDGAGSNILMEFAMAPVRPLALDPRPEDRADRCVRPLAAGPIRARKHAAGVRRPRRDSPHR